MSKCESCGGTNAASATRCEYCDQPLVGRQLIDVAWAARTAEGAKGEGHIAVEAPTGTSTDRVRTIVEAAFASAVDAQGTKATAETIREAMTERLASLLPPDQTLKTLTVASFGAFVLVAKQVGPQGAESAAAPQGKAARNTLALVLLGAGLCCLTSGGLCLIGGMLKTQEAGVVKAAALVSVDEAASASGLVCVEGAVAEVDSAVIVPVTGAEGGEAAPVQTGIACLHVRATISTTTRRPIGTPRPGQEQRYSESVKTRTETTSVERFKLGELVVEPGEGTHFYGLEAFPKLEAGDVSTAYHGLRVGTQLTVVGRVNAGVMKPVSGSQQVMVISSAASRDELVADIKGESEFGFVFGGSAFGLGALALLLSLVGFWRR